MRPMLLNAIAISTLLILSLTLPTQAQDINFPEFSDEAREGGALFMGKCASCHGSFAQGTEKGPPLIHKYYEPNHHSDQSFMLAIRRGARQHHWNFGNMPAVKGVADAEIPKIILYVRELQEANGIN